MDLAYVDKLANDNNGAKYLLVRQDLFDRTAESKRLKKKIARKLFVHLWLWLQKRIDTKIWVVKGTEFAGEFKKLFKAEGIQFYSTIS